MLSTPTLSKQEWDALEHIASTSLLRRVQAPETLQKLRRAGLIDQRLGGDVITAKGRIALRRHRSLI
jgi:ribosomal protein S19E (S16A)